MGKTWLYIYENERRSSVYIGIGASMGRVFEPHNPQAEQLRDAAGTMILQTATPFSTRSDARKAEAIAIHIATLGGMNVAHDNEELAGVTNVSGTRSTKELSPAILTRPGFVDARQLSGTVFVPISAEAIEDRPSPFGGHHGARFADRAQNRWAIRADRRPRITRLIAVLKGANVILGDWDVDSAGDWGSGPGRVSIPLKDPGADDPRGIKGKKLEGHRLNSGVTYSQDLR